MNPQKLTETLNFTTVHSLKLHVLSVHLELMDQELSCCCQQAESLELVRSDQPSDLFAFWPAAGPHIPWEILAALNNATDSECCSANAKSCQEHQTKSKDEQMDEQMDESKDE